MRVSLLGLQGLIYTGLFFIYKGRTFGLLYKVLDQGFGHLGFDEGLDQGFGHLGLFYQGLDQGFRHLGFYKGFRHLGWGFWGVGGVRLGMEGRAFGLWGIGLKP